MRPTVLATAAVLALIASSPAAAQRGSDTDDARWAEQCRSGWGDDDTGRACEVRTVPVRLTGRAIEIDGRDNGSIRVLAWDGDSVRVTARLQARSRTDADAAALLGKVRVSADGRRLTSDGPSERLWSRESWSVSYVVMVPRRFDLALEAKNGALGVTGVNGRIDLRTVNGSVQLADVGGDVHARTQNGSLNVALDGARWDGRGMDAETQNGSVRLSMPERYAASIQTGTVNGTIRTDFPVTIKGTVSRQLDLPLNGGGAPIRATTTNGSVTLSRR